MNDLNISKLSCFSNIKPYCRGIVTDDDTFMFCTNDEYLLLIQPRKMIDSLHVKLKNNLLLVSCCNYSCEKSHVYNSIKEAWSMPR